MADKTGNRPQRAFYLCALAVAGLLVAGAPVRAEDAPADKVVAKVDGEAITIADLEAEARELQDQLARVPAEQRMQLVLDSVVNIKLFEKAAEKAGLDQRADVKRRLAIVHANALRNEYLLDKVGKVVTPETIRKRYDDEAAKFVPGDEYHLYHILVKTEDEAKAIIADLDKGGDFEKIAKEKSSDPGSGAGGGDLGFVGKGKTVQPFEDAAFKLNVGEYTKTPVQTQFGYHVIKLTEKRKEVAPTFEQQQDAIRQEMLSQFLQDEIKTLRAAAKVEIIEDKPPADAAPAAPPADAAAPASPEEPKPAQ